MRIPFEPFKPSNVVEYWCAECDYHSVHSKKPESGSFFIAWGHTFNSQTQRWDGEYKGVMFAICHECSTKEDNTVGSSLKLDIPPHLRAPLWDLIYSDPGLSRMGKKWGQRVAIDTYKLRKALCDALQVDCLNFDI